MLKHVDLLSAKPVHGVGKQSNKPYEYLSLQGVLVYEDGSSEVFTYDFWPRKGEPLPDWKPGQYLPILEPRANWQSRKLEAHIVDMRPAGGLRVKAAA